MRISDWSSDVCSSDPLLLMYGPNTNLGGGSIVYMLEQQARYIVQYVQMLQKLGLRYADVREDVHAAYNRELQQRNTDTAFEAGCHSWYIGADGRSEEHTSELQSLMRISYAVFCLKKNNTHKIT